MSVLKWVSYKKKLICISWCQSSDRVNGFESFSTEHKSYFISVGLFLFAYGQVNDQIYGQVYSQDYGMAQISINNVGKNMEIIVESTHPITLCCSFNVSLIPMIDAWCSSLWSILLSSNGGKYCAYSSLSCLLKKS